MKQPIVNSRAQLINKGVPLTNRTPHNTRDDKSQPEQWGEFLTLEQRQRIVASILATIALRVVRNNQMRHGQIGKSHETA